MVSRLEIPTRHRFEPNCDPDGTCWICGRPADEHWQDEMLQPYDFRCPHGRTLRVVTDELLQRDGEVPLVGYILAKHDRRFLCRCGETWRAARGEDWTGLGVDPNTPSPQ